MQKAVLKASMSLTIQNIFTDNQTDVSGFVYGLVNTPRKNRKRFSASIITVYEDKQQVLNDADEKNNLHPAVLAGPSRSTEGVMLYYLVEWLS